MPAAVAAIVVTYNRSGLLLKTLHGLVEQNYPLARIIIVDNASTDSTAEVLDRQGYIDGSRIGYGIAIHRLRLEENTGGAGGFHHGLAFAQAHTDCTWFWMMDDDVEPTPQALSALLGFSTFSHCLHPRKRYSDGTAITWEGHFDTWTGRTVWNGDASFAAGKAHCSVNYGCFEGMLIHRNIVAVIGLPDRRFFLVNDDLIYGWLAAQHTPVLYINHIGLIKHRIPDTEVVFLGKRENQISDLTMYFNIRNHFLLVEYLRQIRPAPVLYFFLGIKLIKEVLQALIHNRSAARVRMILCGFWDGMQGRFFAPR